MKTARDIAEELIPKLEFIATWARVGILEQALLSYGQQEREKALKEAADICHSTCAWEAKSKINALILKK